MFDAFKAESMSFKVRHIGRQGPHGTSVTEIMLHETWNISYRKMLHDRLLQVCQLIDFLSTFSYGYLLKEGQLGRVYILMGSSMFPARPLDLSTLRGPRGVSDT